MKKNIIRAFFIFLSLLFPTSSFAQLKDAYLHGAVVDAFTREAIKDSVKISLLTQDSVIIQTAWTHNAVRKQNGRDGSLSLFHMYIAPQKNKNFILRYSAPNYQTQYLPIKVIWRKKSNAKINASIIGLRRLSQKERTLGEANVVATKIKFYTKGDTLVYNADAFQLQEGSMLDGLIAQLPGAELTPEGEIKVNGKRIESLLLNGRDFFKGDNTVLLDNLPAYMVHTVQVYEQQSELSKMVGKKTDKGRYVMDVKLKKQYSIGWLANTEWGYGTENRYLGRLFAMRYTPQSRISFYGNLNNVNDRRKPDGNGSWGEFDPTGGLTKGKQGGVDYNIYDKRKRFTLEGNAIVKYTDNESNWNGTSTEFLTNGNHFNVTDNKSNNKDFSVNTAHKFKFIRKNISFSLSPSFKYNHNKYTSTNRNGTFTALQTKDYKAVLDSLFSTNWQQTVRDLVRRNGEEAQGNGHDMNGNLAFWLYIRQPYTYSGFTMEAEVAYDEQEKGDYNHYIRNYYEGGSLQTDYRNRYNSHPSHNFKYNVMGKYIWKLTDDIMLNPSYSYAYSYKQADNMYYRLEALLDETENKPLGWLPLSAADLVKAIDTDNSDTGQLYQHYNSFALDWQCDKRETDANGTTISHWYIRIKPALTIQRNKFFHTMYGQFQQVVDKTYLLPDMEFQISRDTPGYKHYIQFNATLTGTTPPVTDIVSRTYTDDPLNIRKTNPELKQQTELKAQFYYGSNKWNEGTGKKMYAYIGYDVSWNAFVTSYVYDKAIGVRTSTPVNVNGNWDVWFYSNFTTPIDKKQKVTFTNDFNSTFYHLTDFASSDIAEAPTRTVTKKCIVGENAKLNYRYKKVNFGVSGSLSYNYATANRDDFADVNTWSFRYGVNAVVDLPWSMQISTELTMYSRRGYESHEMNRNDLVWNARLSKSVWHSRITFMIDAWDILGNLSNVSSGVNSQKRWEYYYNVIPRYVMLRVVYRLDKQPKKK